MVERSGSGDLWARFDLHEHGISSPLDSRLSCSSSAAEPAATATAAAGTGAGAGAGVGAGSGVVDGSVVPATVTVVRSTEEYRDRARCLPRELGRPALAIDIGSAYGHTTEILARQIGHDGVVGIDVGWKFVDQSRKRCPELRFERLDVLEDQKYVIQLVESCRSARNGGDKPAPAAMLTQPTRHPPKRTQNAKVASSSGTDKAAVEKFTCSLCDKSYSSGNYRSGVAGAKDALAQHVRDIHSGESQDVHGPVTAGDTSGTKKSVLAYVCTVCLESKPLDAYSKNQRNGNKSKIQCKNCNAAIRATRREAAMRERGLLPPSSTPAPGSSNAPEPEPQAQSQPEDLVGKLEPEPKTDPCQASCAKQQSTGVDTARDESVPSVRNSASTTPDGACSQDVWVFVDIGGVRELAALVRLLPFVVIELGASVVVVKSKRLCQTADEYLASLSDQVGQLSEQPAGLNSAGWTFWERVKAAADREGIIGRSKERRGGAPISARYPLKLPVRYTATGVEICRFHNYSQAGCIRGAQGHCSLDHSVCHWCGEEGHVALACEAEVSPAGDDEIDAEAVPNAPIALLDTPAPFLYCLGGRLRGRTLISCERINLREITTSGDEATEDPVHGHWESVQGLSEHRGSHGAAAVGDAGCVMAVGGGGMRANLSSTELLDTRTAASRWNPMPPMQTPRHAFALVSMTLSEDAAASSRKTSLYAIGGWMYGSCCTGSVERYDFANNAEEQSKSCWTPCASLNTPRRLHGAAALGGKLYVFGGSHGNGAVDAKEKTESVECYLPEEDRWEPRCPLPRPMNVAAVAVGVFIYVLPYGGDAMWRYDPSSDSYEDMGPLPLPNYHCFALAAGCALGGARTIHLRIPPRFDGIIALDHDDSRFTIILLASSSDPSVCVRAYACVLQMNAPQPPSFMFLEGQATALIQARYGSTPLAR